MKFSSQPAVHFNGLWKTIEKNSLGEEEIFLWHIFVSLVFSSIYPTIAVPLIPVSLLSSQSHNNAL